MLLLIANFLISYPITLAWDASPSPNIDGYNLYYGNFSHTYTTKIDVKKVTQFQLNLENGETYYFAVTAYRASLESIYSTEISYSKPISITLDRLGILRTSVSKGKRYAIESSTDLKTWSLFTLFTADQSDMAIGVGTLGSSRFFRLRKEIQNIALGERESFIPPTPPFPLPPPPKKLQALRRFFRYRPGHHFKERHGGEDLLSRSVDR